MKTNTTLSNETIELKQRINPQLSQWLSMWVSAPPQLPEIIRHPPRRPAGARVSELPHAGPIASIAAASPANRYLAVQFEMVRRVGERANCTRPCSRQRNTRTWPSPQPRNQALTPASNRQAAKANHPHSSAGALFGGQPMPRIQDGFCQLPPFLRPPRGRSASGGPFIFCIHDGLQYAHHPVEKEPSHVRMAQHPVHDVRRKLVTESSVVGFQVG